jgi:ribosomal protein L18E
VTPPQQNKQTNPALKLIGIFITALATRQGAPFWFDILKRIVNLRGTGANPAEKEGK